MDEAGFLRGLQSLLLTHVAGMDGPAKAAALRRAAELVEAGTDAPRCVIVPFAPGRRPTDEAAFPGMGASQESAVVLDGRDARAHLLFEVGGVPAGDWTVEVAARRCGHDGRSTPVPVPGLQGRTVTPAVFTLDDDRPVLRPVDPAQGFGRRLVLELDPAELTAGDDDALGFADLFCQELRIDLTLRSGGVGVAAASAPLRIFDLRRSGSLYARVLDRVLGPDTARQAAHAGQDDPGPAFHPWFPVLRIGADKADLYTRALIEDVTGGGQNLPDPGWLLRVGLYLEFLTCLGIAEAVRDDLGDLLDPVERAAYELAPQFEALRERVDAEAWRTVWAERSIHFPRRGTPRAGPVALRNLLAKRRATLAFLHVHHADLQQAIELAGPNPHSAQETWQRVFRDAERAVLRQTPEAFPELAHLPAAARDFVLWHRRGQFDVGGTLRVPATVLGAFVDDDGLYASACTQYRASMNHVADWAKSRGLMDHTGDECVPVQVSLLEAYVRDPGRIHVLQERDGFREALALEGLPEARASERRDVRDLLREVQVLSLADEDELEALARAARPVVLGPTERLLRQGDPGGSLFILAEGDVEVMLRREDGTDVLADTMGPGAVIGEMALLTGEPRTASVRAVDDVLAYEIGEQQYAPLLRAHPEWVEELDRMMAARLADRERRFAVTSRTASAGGDSLAGRIRARYFGGPAAAAGAA